MSASPPLSVAVADDYPLRVMFEKLVARDQQQLTNEPRVDRLLAHGLTSQRVIAQLILSLGAPDSASELLRNGLPMGYGSPLSDSARGARIRA
jgi:hypothetical protein